MVRGAYKDGGREGYKMQNDGGEGGARRNGGVRSA